MRHNKLLIGPGLSAGFGVSQSENFGIENADSDKLTTSRALAQGDSLMERLFSPILALGLIFGTFAAQAAPTGAPKDFALQTKYTCQANGVIIHNKQKLISNGLGIDEIQYVAGAGRNQTLTLGGDREYMIWPRAANGTFNKSLNVLARDKAGTYKIVQEIDMGDTAKTKTSVSVTVKDREGEDRPVSCRIEMAWTKK